MVQSKLIVNSEPTLSAENVFFKSKQAGKASHLSVAVPVVRSVHPQPVNREHVLHFPSQTNYLINKTIYDTCANLANYSAKKTTLILIIFFIAGWSLALSVAWIIKAGRHGLPKLYLIGQGSWDIVISVLHFQQGWNACKGWVTLVDASVVAALFLFYWKRGMRVRNYFWNRYIHTYSLNYYLMLQNIRKLDINHEQNYINIEKYEQH